MAVTDADGIIYYRYVYDTYGELSDITTDDGVSLKSSEQLTEYRLAELAHATGIDYLYNGQYGVETDANGLYYMRARYYNQDIKRFINRDIVSGDIDNSQSLNRYCYVQGNPVSLTDPFGLCPDGNAGVLSVGFGGMLGISAAFALYGRPIESMSGSDAQGSSWGHIALDILGIFFDGADLINAVWYALEGNREMAIISGICALPFVGNLIGGTVGLALKVVGSGLTFSLAAKGTFDAVGRAYQDYKNGTLGWHNVLDISLNGLALAGTGYMFKKGIGDALNGKVPQGIPGWLSEHTIPLNNKGFVDLKALKGLFSKRGIPSDEIIGTSYDINKLKKTQPYTYPEGVEKYKNQILLDGPNSIEPIPIRIHNGEALIVDGHHRYEAFKQLGYKRVPIKYLHKSNLGKLLPNGDYYRTLEELLRDKIN